MPCPTEYDGVVDEALTSETDATSLATAQLPKWRRGAAALCALGAVAALVATGVRPRLAGQRSAAVTPRDGVVMLQEEEGGCGGPGETCTDSKCCWDAGPSGYQCFAKNDDWAQCLESCKKGPHEDETDGEYNQYGDFVKFEWSCKKLGKRSLKGCDSLGSEKKCGTEPDRCTWGSKNGKDACLILCPTLPADSACESQEHCMSQDGKCRSACGDSLGSEKKCGTEPDLCTWGWKNGTDACLILCTSLPADGACGSQEHCMSHDGKCRSACTTYGDEDKCPTDRCSWAGDKCVPACFAITDEGTCSEAMWDPRGCIWKDNQCMEDPCSAMDENCLDKGCCSAARGGQGKTCFKKDKNYGKCMEVCDKKEDETKGWSCKAIGNRTKWEIGCAWIGHDCSDTHLCCQAGAGCIVKDEEFTGCVQTQKLSTWDSQPVPIPDDWEGTTLGGSRDEYQVAPAGEGEEKADARLFCFMAYLPDSGEVGLMQVAKDLGASIYGCEEHAEFESWGSEKKQWDTGDGGASITNTDVFINVWEQVREDGRYLKTDWTVKVDPDAVMVADRLKNHIYGLNPKKDTPIYLKNNNMDAGLGNNGFLGAIEVFSKQAVQIYFDNWEGCKEAYGLDSGEDGFFKGCMDAMGVGFMVDGDMFDPDYSPGACGKEERAAFHPLKEPAQWRCCWDIIMGKLRDVKFGVCDMGPDGMGPEEDPDAFSAIAR